MTKAPSMPIDEHTLLEIRGSIYRYAKRRVGSDADDIAQETLAAVIRRAKQGPFNTRPIEYAYKTASNKIADVFRRKHPSFDPALHAITTVTGVATREARVDAIARAQEAVSAEEWDAFELHYSEGLSNKQVAAIFEVSEATIKRRIKRARDRMGAELADHVAREMYAPD